MDYVGQPGTLLTFNAGDARVCASIVINDDNHCEVSAEKFFVQLTLVSGELPININPALTSTQVIIDDSAEPECGKKD